MRVFSMDGRNMDVLEVNVVREVRDVISTGRRRKQYLQRNMIMRRYDDHSFKMKYRLSKQSVRNLIDMIRPSLWENTNRRGLPISVETRVLLALRFFARGGFQDDLADLHNVSQATASRIVADVARAICSLAREIIKFPPTEERLRIVQQFHEIAAFPQVMGVVDGTHIRIKNPGGEHSQTFINRKGWYSLNVQVICNASFKILDIVAKWRGSAHDSRVFNECPVRRRFENEEFHPYVLLGDAGYALQKYLFTPLRQPRTDRERLYNSSHKTTRNVVERCFGCWKGRFRCLSLGLNTKLNTSKNVILACAVLHNLILLWKEDLSEFFQEDEGNMEDNIVAQDNERNDHFRSRFILNNF